MKKTFRTLADLKERDLVALHSNDNRLFYHERISVWYDEECDLLFLGVFIGDIWLVSYRDLDSINLTWFEFKRDRSIYFEYIGSFE